MIRIIFIVSSLFFLNFSTILAQSLQLPDQGTNLKSMAGRKIGNTEIEIHWSAPGVKGREGKIWGTSVAWYGFDVLGFGSNMASPWRAGADENTTISFSTDVMINGQKLPAGNYGFFIALYADSSTLIFNQHTKAWGSYFYNKDLDVLKVKTIQQKDRKESIERLQYTFANQTEKSVEVALEWEKWRIPFTVEIDMVSTTLASFRTQLSGVIGFDPPSLESAASWSLQNATNYEEALGWINRATDPNLGGVQSFKVLSTKAGLLEKMNKPDEAKQIMDLAVENGSVMELHQYGRQLLAEKKNAEALVIFEKNHKKFKGAWPTNGGMMRGLSAFGNYKEALKYAKLALPQAPNEENKKFIEQAIKTLSEGKPL